MDACIHSAKMFSVYRAPPATEKKSAERNRGALLKAEEAPPVTEKKSAERK